MTLNNSVFVDGFMKKAAGLDGSHTWNDIKFYASSESASSPYAPWTGTVEGESTHSYTDNSGQSTVDLYIIGAAFAPDNNGEYRYPDTFQLIDGNTIGINYWIDVQTPWYYIYPFIMSFIVTITS